MSDLMRARVLGIISGRRDGHGYRYGQRFNVAREAALLAYAARWSDEEILDWRGAGHGTLRWIRTHQPTAQTDDPTLGWAGPAYLGNPHDSPIWRELADELDRAVAKHPPMHSPHEGHSVIREELDVELWEHVCHDTGRSSEARHEAMQVAAMALRYIVDLIDDQP